MVQQIGAAVCPMQCALITHLRAGFHLPAAGLYFANIEAHVGTAVPQTFKQAEGSYACPSMRFDVGLPFVGQEHPARSTEELLVGRPVTLWRHAGATFQPARQRLHSSTKSAP